MTKRRKFDSRWKWMPRSPIFYLGFSRASRAHANSWQWMRYGKTSWVLKRGNFETPLAAARRNASGMADVGHFRCQPHETWHA